jgi:hypothetical protein
MNAELTRWRKVVATGILALLWTTAAEAEGSLDPSAPPASSMHTLEDLYQKQAQVRELLEAHAVPRTFSATTTVVRAGSYPATNLATVDPDLAAENIAKDVAIFGVTGTLASGGGAGVIRIPRTGQTASFATGDDGNLQKGLAWPSPRFTDNGNGTMTDQLTELVWVKAPHALPGNSGAIRWTNAVDLCNALVYAGHDDWRLPNLVEIESLRNMGAAVLSTWLNSQGFSGIQPDMYWSSSELAGSPNSWFYLHFGNSAQGGWGIATSLFAWPVRGDAGGNP